MIPKQELGRRLNAHPGTVAVVPRFSGVGLNLALQLDLGGSAQGLAQDLRFVAKLGCVVDVLVLTASTAAEIGAAGLDAFSGALDDVI